MNKKARKKLAKIARANIAVGLIAVAILADNNVEFAKKHDEIIFINSSVIRTEAFVNSLPHNAEVIYLDRKRSGLDQITEYLSEEEDVDAVRIISHGNSGYMVLNGQVVDEEFLADNSEAISTWKDALTEDADIMLYGCKIAATDEGKSFVKQLAELTGADVAAATKEIGGQLANWTLDYRSGEIEAFTLRIDDYEFHLANQVVTATGNSGAGTLRQAIIDAGDGDEITFSLSDPATITISEDLDIAESLTIDGDNTSGSGTDVTIQVTTPGSGGSAWRVFNIDASGKTVNLSNMTIKGGDISDNVGHANKGGGIYNKNGTLNIDNCLITGSKANTGGGFNNYDHTSATIATISNSTISGCEATVTGGGIESNATISSISNSTISGNTAGSWGGGIANYNSNISTIQNTTISGNTGSRGGGIGIYKGSITLLNSTISGNTASGTVGGGIYQDGVGTLTVKNTIIADNSGSDDYYYAGGTLTSSGYNIVKYSNVAANTGNAFDNANDILYNTKYGVAGTSFTSWTQNASVLGNQNLNLSSTLADNGGSTQTLALSAGSFAIDAGTDSGAPTTDQRGASRNSTTDIGAFEYNSAGFWTGKTNTSWSNTGNWDDGSVAGASTNVTIPNGTNDPVISVTDDASCNNLTVNSGGSLTVQSTSSNTGSLIVNGTATGDVTVQRYIAAYSTATDGWHFLSTPVATFTINGSSFDPGDNDDLYRWQESTALWMNHKAGDPTQIVAGTGYLTAWESTATKTFTGTPNNSDISVSSLSYTSATDYTGWHLLGNPYPSALYWNKTTWSLSNVDATAKIWVESSASYTDIAASTGVIPAAQGFMVRVSASTGSLTIDASDRTHNSQNWYKDAEVNKIKLTAFDPEGNTAQESIISFNENATPGIDSEYDSYFLSGYAPYLYSAAEGIALSTNTLPEITAQTTIPLSFIKNGSSDFYIEVEGVNELQPQETVYLTDLKTNHTQLLNDDPVYSFTSEEGDVAERFVIHFSPLGVDDLAPISDVNIYAANGKVELRNNKPIDATIKIYNMSGQLLSNKELVNESSTFIKINNYKGPAVVSVITSNNVINKKVIIW